MRRAWSRHVASRQAWSRHGPARQGGARSYVTPRLAAEVAGAIPVMATVATFGELSLQAFLVVLLVGLGVSAVGLSRRAGSAAAPVGRAGRPWLAWLAVLAGWELVTRLADARLPTLSDLADPLLAHPPVRAAATGVWLAAGGWLARRPSTLERTSG